MTTNFHTAISVGADADAATFNSPMSELDTQITSHNTEIIAARGSESSIDARLDASLDADGTISSDAVDSAQIATNAVGASEIANNAIIGQAQINLGDAGAAGGDVVRYDEFIQEHAAGGGHSAGVIDQNEINLTSAGVGAGDAIRYDEYNGHIHVVYDCLYAAFGEQQAGNGAADAIPSWTRDDSTTNELTVLNLSFYKRADADDLRLTGEKSNDHATQSAQILLNCGGQTATETVAALAAGVDFSLSLDISSLGDNAIHNITVGLKWPVSAAGAATLTLTSAQVWSLLLGVAPT
jgi:hypothetical protein